MSEVVHLERHASWAQVIIDHPPANAVSRAVVGGLRDALREAAGTGARALVITGAGDRFFSAGADVKEFAVDEPPLIAEGQNLTLEIERSDLPVIAAVNGMCFGGGMEIALACDVRVAAARARFGQPEVKLGIMPGWGGTQRLPRVVGHGRGLALLLTGETVDAAGALEIGLVSDVTPDAELMARASAFAEQLAALPPLALAAIKRATSDGAGRPIADGLNLEHREFHTLLGTEDAREGVSAFLEKRTPRWRGR